MAGRDFPRLEEGLRQQGRPDPYGRALRSLRPWMLMVALFSTILNILMLTGSIYMLQIYDRVLSSGSVPTLLGLFAIVMLLYGFLGIYDFLRARMLGRAGLQLDAAMALPAFQVWLRSATSDGRPRPELGPDPNRALRDLETIRGFAASPGAAVLFDLPFVPFFIAILFLLHPWLGMATIAGAGLAATVALVGRWLTERGMAAAAPQETAPRTLAEAGRRSAETVLAMGMERSLGDRWRQLHEAGLAAGQGTTQMNEGLTAGSRAFRMFLQSAILTLGAYLTLQGEITAGMIIAGSILSGRALAPIDQAVGQAKMLGRARDSHRRLRALSASLPAPARTVTLPAPEGRLEVIDLTRLAPPVPGQEARERRRILTGIRFELEPGDAVGVIGPSASGKSTLARLLVGAQQPDGGEVRLGGAALSQYQKTQLQTHVGYLPQRVDLLPGSIRDNIARFDPEARDETVIAAAQAAGVHEMILALPEGYGTEIGSAQTMLSGGQVQRIGLARALFGTPALVVLDEPNAHLDAAGDKALTRAVEHLRSSGAAVVIMAHRPGALAAVNKLMLLEGGQVRTFGDKRDVIDLVTGPDKPAATMAPRSADESIRFRKSRPKAGPDPASRPKVKPRVVSPSPRAQTKAQVQTQAQAKSKSAIAARAKAASRTTTGAAKTAPAQSARSKPAQTEGTAPRQAQPKRAEIKQATAQAKAGPRAPTMAPPEQLPMHQPTPLPQAQPPKRPPQQPDSLPEIRPDQPPARVREKLSRRLQPAVKKGSAP